MIFLSQVYNWLLFITKYVACYIYATNQIWLLEFEYFVAGPIHEMLRRHTLQCLVQFSLSALQASVKAVHMLKILCWFSKSKC